MNTSVKTSFVNFAGLRAAFVAASFLLPAFASGQGQLTPPGPVYPYPSERALNPALNPIPSMKTLMHIEMCIRDRVTAMSGLDMCAGDSR